MGLILDTCFVIELERRIKRNEPEFLDDFAARFPAESLFVTFAVVGELACGNFTDGLNGWRRLWSPFPVLPWSPQIGWEYGFLYRHLAADGNLIGTNDLWIAATARVHGYGVVTNNEREFGRVPDLKVVPFQ